MYKYIHLLAAVVLFFGLLGCTTDFPYDSSTFEEELVVECILDPSEPVFVFLENTYPTVGVSQMNQPFAQPPIVELYEDDILIEKLEGKKGENFFKTVPSETSTYQIVSLYKGKRNVSEKVKIPPKPRIIGIENIKLTRSQLNQSEKAVEFDVRFWVDTTKNTQYGIQIVGKNGAYKGVMNEYNVNKTDFVESPCIQTGRLNRFIFTSICQNNGKLSPRLGAEINYIFSINNDFRTSQIYTYKSVEVRLEAIGESYLSYLTDILPSGIDRIFMPYYSSYSNMSRGIGVLVARNSVKMELLIPPL